MALVMRSQGELTQSFVFTLAVLVGALSGAREGAAQALYSERIGVDTELLLITQPLSDATTFAWPLADGTVVAATSGGFTVAADLEAAFAGLEGAPPVVVAVGGAQVTDLRTALEIALGTRPAWSAARLEPGSVEGGVDRRLGAAGSEAALRLEVRLPEAGDWRRSTVEVVWEMLPDLLGEELPGLVSRVEGDLGRLEARIDPELAEVKLRQLRLQLARIFADPRIDSSPVEAARQRLMVRRQAELAMHPEGARILAELWVRGGETAVREYLFGVDGVTLATVRAAAQQWLPQHPGQAVLVLPPRVFNPRFAPGPQRVQLVNDVVAEVLERPGAGLSAVCLQPVLVPDVDGQLTGTVLTRLAAEIRSSEGAPGWVRVHGRPPLLELAAPSEATAELVEVLQGSLVRIAADDRPVGAQEESARRRALRLMGRLLGMGEGMGLSPAELLQPSNLALGVVAPDAESAIEALEKFEIGGTPARGAAASRTVAPVPRTREAVTGGTSVLVVGLDLPQASGEEVALVVGAVVERRSVQLLPDLAVAVLRPLVPGRSVLLLVVEAAADLDALEGRVREVWQTITGPVTDGEIADLRRRLAADVAAETSGPVGHARRLAAVAAGAATWRLPSDLGLAVLTLPAEAVTELLAAVGPWQDQLSAGAGVLPLEPLAAP